MGEHQRAARRLDSGRAVGCRISTVVRLDRAPPSWIRSRESLPVLLAVQVERAPDPVAGVEPYRGLQAPDRRDEVSQRVVPGSLFVAEEGIVVPCVMLFAKLQPASCGEPQGVSVRVHGEGKLPQAREVLALIELDDESRVGNPVVTACEHLGSHERADAIPAISLQNLGHVSENGLDRGSRVRCEARPPPKSAVAHARPVDALDKLPDPVLARVTPPEWAWRGSYAPSSPLDGAHAGAVADTATAVALDDGEPGAGKLVGLRASGKSVRSSNSPVADLMGQRNLYFGGRCSPPSPGSSLDSFSRWHAVTDDEPYGLPRWVRR